MTFSTSGAVCPVQNSTSNPMNGQLPIHPDYKGYLDIWTAVESIKSIWKRHAARNGTVITSMIDRSLPSILGVNSIAFQHCLSNLVENAVKYTDRGQIEIFVTRIQRPNEMDSIAFTVRDTGCGIGEDEMATLFEKTNTAKSLHGQCFGAVNTGLPMTKMIASELGGRVMVQSKPFGGSVFSIVLPLEHLASFNDDDNVREKLNAPHAHLSRLNVLVVDDFELNQLTVKTLLHGAVAHVHCASGGFEALEILKSAPIDIVLMDIHMPELDGIETTLRIRESRTSWADIAIIALTADPDYQHAHICRKIGMDGALAKPIRRQDLLAIFAEYCPQHLLSKAG